MLLENKRFLIQKASKWILLSIMVGIFAGLTSAFFLYLLDIATNTRIKYSFLIWFLPLVGLFIGWIYHLYGSEAAKGNNLILEEIHNPNNILPLRMAPMVLVGTILTHLFGGSAGREGTAVQMAASLADQVNYFFKVGPLERKILLMAGAGAGFGSAMGTPIAGMIFGMEVIYIGKLHLNSWPQCLIASFTGYYTCILLKAPHSHYPNIIIPDWNFKIILSILAAAVIFGLAALCFGRFTHFVEYIFKKIIQRAYLIPFVGGSILVLLYYIEGSYGYAGLGINFIQEALEKMVSFREPLLKTFFTSLTLGAGFKGGEFVPLVFIGTTLGSALGTILPISFSLLAALGFVAVFAGAANTPLACALMAAEIFGWKIFFYALMACYVSYYFSGHSGIYRMQFIYNKKHHRLKKLLAFFIHFKR